MGQLKFQRSWSFWNHKNVKVVFTLHILTMGRSIKKIEYWDACTHYTSFPAEGQNKNRTAILFFKKTPRVKNAYT